MSKLSTHNHDPNIHIVTGACPHDCPDTCSWQVATDIASGRAVDMWGHPQQPVTRGSLCAKVDHYLERVYHSGRLTTPLRRVGAKGSGQFEPISWPDAVSIIATRLQDIIDRHGPQAVLPYSYAGTMGLLQGEGMAQRFFNRMGASHLARTICSEAGFEGYLYTIGAAEGMETESFAHSRLILIWGSNTLTSNVHLWPFVQAAKKQGARVIVIDPARTRTARLAGEWIPIRPGTDGALALAMMHVIITERLYDAEYVHRHTIGFEDLATRVVPWTPERAEQITGIPAERIIRLARDYATIRPAAVRINYGLQRHAGGGMAVRTITCLPTLIGAWRQLGGGLQLSTSGAFRHLDLSGLQRPDLLGDSRPRTLNMNRLGDSLSTNPVMVAQAHYHPKPIDPVPAPQEAGPIVKALIVYNSNPAAVAPDQSAVIRGLLRDDLFTVVLEQFQTDTADYADIVLPATTQLEHWDIVKPYGHLHLALNRPAIAPVADSLPNSEIFRRLAHAMGYCEPCFTQEDEEILRELVESQTHARFASITWDKLLADGFVRLNLPQPYLPFAEGNFPTTSGKCELFSLRMAQDGYDPLPDYVPPAWLTLDGEKPLPSQNGHSEPGESHEPLVCISPPAHSFLNSTFGNIERCNRRERAPVVQIHPDDACARHIQDGSLLCIWNQLGTVHLTAHVTDIVMPGTVLAPGIWWSKFSPDGRNINQITSQREADMGAGACFYDTQVWLEVTESIANHEEEEEEAPMARAVNSAVSP